MMIPPLEIKIDSALTIQENIETFYSRVSETIQTVYAGWSPEVYTQHISALAYCLSVLDAQGFLDSKTDELYVLPSQFDWEALLEDDAFDHIHPCLAHYPHPDDYANLDDNLISLTLNFIGESWQMKPIKH